ncbi:hypothetical protein [Okeania sp. KiyG1]|uniref:hypothetical protein n=1 Tax=Okeania sp. KiyG1 TaxID=2720165 RepID=UPI001920E6F8|nr:hypothetical protein [Okeania sp. KiyG1]GGA24876.1 hypothetical protein CYANOKiyG1_40550 [Okeania sp. KiyG1]
MSDRGEFFWKKDYKELDIRHLFYGREISLGSKFSIVGTNDKNHKNIVASIQTDSRNKLDEQLDDLGEFNYDIKEILSDNSEEISDVLGKVEDIFLCLIGKEKKLYLICRE